MTSTSTSKHPILIVTENLEIGGAEKYTVLVANELHARGHRVVVFANEGPFRKHFHPDIRFVRAFFEHGIFGVLYGAFQMVRITRQEHIPLIHAQKLASSKAAWLARFVTRVPVVKTAHGYTPAELVHLGKKIDTYSDKVISVVDWLLPELQKNGVRADKLSVIHNGMEPAERISAEERAALRNKLGILPTDRVAISVARLEKGKNYAALLEWFKAVAIEVPQAKLVLVGDGPQKKQLKQICARMGLAESIIFVDGTTNTNEYLSIADVFCTPSIGRGMAVLEAMEIGLPVVGVEPLGEPQVIAHGETGYMVPKGDGKMFAQKVATLLREPALAQRMGEAGKRRAREMFSHKRMIDQLKEVYEEAIASA